MHTFLRPVRRYLRSLSPLDERHVIWLPQQRLAYLRVPKAANSSIRYTLAHVFDLTRIEGMTPAKDKYWQRLSNREAQSLTTAAYCLRRTLQNSWSFSFVRHPVSRLYSCWSNKIIENEALTPKLLAMGLTKGMSFADFVACVTDCPDSHSDIHIRSQASILMHKDRLVPDFIGRVEQMEEDWSHVRYEMRLRCGTDPGPVKFKNVRVRADSTADGALTDRLEQMIRARFAQDFALFYPD